MTREQTTTGAFSRLREREIVTPPTQRQLFVLSVIDEHQAAKGYPITIRELCRALGISSTMGAADHLRALERRRLITRDERVARSVLLTAAGKSVLAAHRLRAAHPECSGGEG